MNEKKIFQITQGLALLVALGAGVVALFGESSELTVYLGSRTELISEKLEDLEKQQREVNATLNELDNLIAMVENSNTDEVQMAALKVRLTDLGERLATVEETLDLAPREILSLVLLERSVGELENDVAQATEQTLREIDRAYNTVLALIGALLVSVILLIVGNFVKQGKQS